MDPLILRRIAVLCADTLDGLGRLYTEDYPNARRRDGLPRFAPGAYFGTMLVGA
jgi:hypothetical protein|eukprot:SAG25_NODE_1352_length_3224_cov_1.871360_4_plen_54_part_00